MARLKQWNIVILLSFLFCTQALTVQGQQKPMSMTLEECLKYAKEHSIALKKANLQVKNTAVDEKTARAAFLPSLSASVGQNLVNSPYAADLNQTTNAYSGTYGLDASMTLYSGGRNISTLKQTQLNTKIANLDAATLESSLELDVTQAYIRILYAIDQVEVNKHTVELSQRNLERGQSLLEIGSMNQADLAQLETAVATEQYNLISAEIARNELFLQLKQLLEIDEEMTLNVIHPDLSKDELQAPIPLLADVYAAASVSRPEIIASQYNVEAFELGVNVAKSGYMPTVSLTAGSGFNHMNAADFTFSQQLKNSWSNSIGLRLSIPIFNKRTTKSAVEKSKFSVQTAKLTLQESEKTLYRTIEDLYNNAMNAQAKYQVANYKLTAVKKSLDLTTQQYELGLKNIIELLTEQDNYRKSSQEYLENKYTLILNKAFLCYYECGIIKI